MEEKCAVLRHGPDERPLHHVGITDERFFPSHSPMDQATWTALDEYLSDRLISSDAGLEQPESRMLKRIFPPSTSPQSEVSSCTSLCGCATRRVFLRSGHSMIHSTIWLVRAVPEDGVVITLKSEPKRAELAAKNLKKADPDRRGDATSEELRLSHREEFSALLNPPPVVSRSRNVNPGAIRSRVPQVRPDILH